MPFFRLLLVGFLALSALRAETPPLPERTPSPYLFVPGGKPGLEEVPLQSTEVDVAISGVIADVTLTQVYRNRGQRPIEAIYVFPGSTRAAVHGLRLTVGGRTTTAKIARRSEARQTYEKAKSEGKSAALLEEARANVFQMAVANLLPGDDLRVELRYTELLVPEEGSYEFVFPTVVGPRYVNRPASADGETGPPAGAPREEWARTPHLPKGFPGDSTFALRVTLATGLPLREVVSPSHALRTEFLGKSEAAVTLPPETAGADNRDFILRYRLAGDAVESGVLVGNDSGPERPFLLLLQPPERVPVESVPPREYLFVVDVSGSMRGFPLATARDLLRQLAETLRPTDSFNVLFFSGGSRVLSPASLPATKENRARALAMLSAEQGGGGTELLPALRRVLEMPAQEGRSRSIVVVTDGYVTVEEEAFALVRGNLGRANLFAFGIGSAVNRQLIEQLARAGQGEPFVVTTPDEAAPVAQRFRDYVQSPVLTEVRVEVEGVETRALEPAVLPDLLASRPLVLSGSLLGEPKGRLIVTGRTAAGLYRAAIDLASAARADAATLRRLGARQRLTRLADEQAVLFSAERVEEIVTLGLENHLLTPHTAFVAVDEVVRRAPGDSAETARQPLPLPRGVENSAVGATTPVVPEPSTTALLGVAVLLAALGGRAWRRGRGQPGNG